MAVVLGHLGALLQASNKYDRAKVLLERALSIEEKLFTPVDA